MVWIFVWEWTGQDYSAMQWPCPTWFHIPMSSEWQDVLDILTTIWYDNDTKKGLGFVIVLWMPLAWQRDYSTSNPQSQDGSSYWIYWCSTNNYRCIDIRGTSTQFKNYYQWYWYLIRPFKDVAVVPDSSWTKVDDYQVAIWWIYRNTTLWLISLSWDWINWITIADKNLWATAVFDNTAFWTSNYTEANCGKYYQWWNNYWFPFTWSVTTSSTQVNASSYWPWNYYNSSTFITQQNWDSSVNNDLWWGETGIRGFPNVEEIFIWEWIDTYRAMRWPCPEGFHVPLQAEFETLNTILEWLWYTTTNDKSTALITYLKMPKAWNLYWSSGNKSWVGDDWQYWSSKKGYNSYAYALYFSWNSFSKQLSKYTSAGASIRPFRDEPVIPDNTWTVEYQWIWNAGIYSNATLWLISISSDGVNRITISNKNLWATTVYNNWDTLSQSNCWNYYQRWNNYWFPFTWPVTISTTQVDVTDYWPWNYYSSDTFICWNQSNQNWFSVINKNLRWWETWITKKWNVIEVYQGTTKIREKQ